MADDTIARRIAALLDDVIEDLRELDAQREAAASND